MSDATKPGCPFCGEPDGEIDDVSNRAFAVVCQNCGAIGPRGKTQIEAAKLWDQRFNRLDWPVTWLKMPDDPRAAGITVSYGVKEV